MKRAVLQILVLLLSLSLSAQNKAVVDVSVAHLREMPDYAAEMGTEALMGTIVEVCGSSGYWVQVKTPDGYKAWVNEMSLKGMTDAQLLEYRKFPKLLCLADYSRIRSRARKESQPVSDLVRGDILVDMLKRQRGFSMVSTPSGKMGWVRKKDVIDRDKWGAGQNCTGDNVVREALRQVGVPYLWGGMSPKGFDCSGLVSFAFMMNSATLPRNASQQAKLGDYVDISALKDRDCSCLKKGDLLFFGNKENRKVSHVGIYIGGGKMVHSSQIVRVNSILSGDSDCYENIFRLLFVKRICNE